MRLHFCLVTICSIALTTAQLNYENPSYLPEYEQTQSSYSLALTQQQLPNEETPVADAILSTQFQPPRPDAPRPFFIVEPSDELKPPTKEAVPFSYDPSSYPPVPSEELQLPSEDKWNPNNDPYFYYPTEIPTKLYPKKFNKELSKKTKPILTDEELAAKQKFVEKVLLSLEKQENKKRLEQEKKRIEQEQQESRDSYEKVSEPSTSETFSSPNALYGLSHDGDRMEFQVHGHDGPKTYKWGFDTGKGHNRQFRYEEKNKDGIVKGHYGYYDKHGKLRVVNYDSHPHEGFRAHEANTDEDH